MISFEVLKELLPDLTIDDLHPITGTITLRDDADGLGVYIEKWEYKKPLPEGFLVGKFE